MTSNLGPRHEAPMTSPSTLRAALSPRSVAVIGASENPNKIGGPNPQALANFGTGAIASFSTMFLESPPQDGPVAIVSQSGAMSVVPYGLLRARGIGVRHTHATGNDADVTAAELARAVLEDP